MRVHVPQLRFVHRGSTVATAVAAPLDAIVATVRFPDAQAMFPGTVISRPLPSRTIALN
jgi:hypothetical protein